MPNASSVLLLLACLLFVGLSDTSIDKRATLECFQCTDESNLINCGSTTICGHGKTCYAEKSRSEDPRYSLGCIRTEVCKAFGHSGGTIGKRDWDEPPWTLESRSKRALQCQKCCHTPRCNLELCGTLQKATHSPGTPPTHGTTMSTEALPLVTPEGPQYGSVRIVGKAAYQEGRIEVFLNGQWEEICDTSYDYTVASIVCSMLGYPGTNVIWWGLDHTEGGEVWLNAVNCTGSETQIDQCHLHQSNTCPTGRAANVACPSPKNGDLRLKGGNTAHEGRLELYDGGEWGGICNHLFDQNAAAVVCQQLEFESTGAVDLREWFFGPYSGVAWTQRFLCTGNENRVQDCLSFSRTQLPCSKSNVVGVRCSVPADGHIRLTGGKNRSEGRVEIAHNTRWGAICDDSFDDKAAAVVCSSLGFSRAGAKAMGSSHFGVGRSPIWLDDIQCAGHESSLLDCKHGPWSKTNCMVGYEDAGVICEREAKQDEGRSSLFWTGIAFPLLPSTLMLLAM